MECGELRGALFEYGLIYNSVAPIDCFGFVSRHFHRRGTRHASPLQISHSGPAEVMRNAAGESGSPACALPRCPKVLDLLAVAMKQPRNNPACRQFEIAGALKLPAQDSAQFWREREEPPFPIFRLARLKAQPAVFQVEMVTLASIPPCAASRLKVAPLQDRSDLEPPAIRHGGGGRTVTLLSGESHLAFQR